MADPLAHDLRAMAKQPPPQHPDAFASWFGYMTHGYVVVSARMLQGDSWWSASNDDRRMFMLLVAEDLETFWS